MLDNESAGDKPTDRDAPTFDNDQCEHTDRGTGQCPNMATRTVFIAHKNTTQRLCDKHAQAVGPDGRDSEVSAR